MIMWQWPEDHINQYFNYDGVYSFDRWTMNLPRALVQAESEEQAKEVINRCYEEGSIEEGKIFTWANIYEVCADSFIEDVERAFGLRDGH